MKKITKIMTAALAATFALVPFSACGGGTEGGDASTVEIYYWKSGLGGEFMTEIVKDFNNKQSDYVVKVEQEESASTIIQSLSLGRDNTYDLYFTMLNTTQYNNQFIKLDDVLDSTATGESKTIREKYYDYLLNGVKNADGTTNFLTYGNSWCGIVYNADIIDGDKYAVPNTTDELDKLVSKLKDDETLEAKGVKPWLFYNNADNNGYWDYVTMTWEAQYDGVDYYYNNMLALKDEQGNTPSKDVFEKRDGRYKALKTLEGIVTPTTVHSMCTSTNFTNVQSLYLNGSAVLTVNGSWLMNESTGSNKNFAMMKTPVISSIVEKLEDTSMSDSTLSQIIAQVDAGANSSELCSQNDFNRIKEARNLLYNNASEQYVFIPEYSNAIDGAKAFLKYFYSDEGIAKYMQVTNLPSSAALCDETKFSTDGLDAWHKAQLDYAKTSNAITNVLTKSSVFTTHSLTQFASFAYAQPLCAQNPKDKLSADEIWEKIVNKIETNWEDWS